MSIPNAKVLIMDASFAAFNEKGFQAVSMDEIAKQLRMSKKTIYKHFGSKEELLESALVNLFGSVEQRLVVLERQKSPKDVLPRYFEIFKSWKLSHSEALKVELKTTLPYLADRVENFERQILLRHLISYLKDLRAENIIDYPSPSREFAMAFFQLMGSMVHANEAHASYFLQSLFRGMGIKKKKKNK